MNPWDLHDADLEREFRKNESYEDGSEYSERITSILVSRNKAEYYANLAKELVEENNDLRKVYLSTLRELTELKNENGSALLKATADLVEQIAALKRERDRLLDRNELLTIRIQNLENLNG